MRNIHKVCSSVLIALLAVSVFPSAGFAEVVIDRNLIPGRTGEDVAIVQQFLIETNKLDITAPTGYYGPLTTSAVAEWQKEQGITPTGNVGPITRSKLNSGVLESTFSGRSSGGGSNSGSSSGIPLSTIQVPRSLVEAFAKLVGTSTATTVPATVSVSSGGATGGAVTTSTGRRRGAPPPVASAAPTVTYATVSSTSPADGATGVVRDRGIRITFGGAMDSSSIDSSSITVTVAGTPVDGTLEYLSASHAAVFLPDSELPASTEVEVLVSKSVKDAAGNGLQSDYWVTFTTGTGFSSDDSVALGSAADFAILASGLDNASPTTVKGSVGTGAGGQSSSISISSGTNNRDNAAYATANADLASAILDSKLAVCDTNTSGSANIGGQSFQPGVHCFDGPVTLDGSVSLLGDGDYLFRVSDSFISTATSSVLVLDGAHPSDVTWTIDGGLNAAASSTLLGNFLVSGAVAASSTVTVDGRLLSLSAVETGAGASVRVPDEVYCSTLSVVYPSSQAPGGIVTAAYVPSDNSTVSVDVNARGCNVGVFIASGRTVAVNAATVHDAYKVGIYNDGGAFDISSSTIYNIGDRDENDAYRFAGTQTGHAIRSHGAATGSIVGNTIYDYQKAGIVLWDATNMVIKDNVITGVGSTTINAQIGIQVSKVPLANVGNISGNIVSENIYSPSIGSSVGIMVGLVSSDEEVDVATALRQNNTVTGYGDPEADVQVAVF